MLMGEGVIGQVVAVLQQVRDGQVVAACLAALTNIAWENGKRNAGGPRNGEM
jgi:hypothetical protein